VQPRCVQTFYIQQEYDLLKQQLLFWCDRFSHCCFLDSQHYSSPGETPLCLAASGAVNVFTTETNPKELFAEIESFEDWLFGHISYHTLHAQNGIQSPQLQAGQFPATFLFCPETLFTLTKQTLTISTLSPSAEEIWKSITAIDIHTQKRPLPAITFTPGMERTTYLQRIEQLLQHIHRGDCYEINFCQEFFSSPVTIPAVATYLHLMAISPNPFSSFYKNDGRYVLCASPERFLQKKGRVLRSQPIKGTMRRNTTDLAEDELLKEKLRSSMKNQSENIMVVDLVRNDLSRVCREGTVRVSELLGLYSFPQVHQLISTIEGELLPGTTLFDVLSATFPMGSMTGAPKKKVMELIEQYEPVPRGIYSGSIGYITPEKDFDWNVVIRSLVYLPEQQYLSYHVGGGITANSEPEQELEECFVKARALQSLWNQ